LSNKTQTTRLPYDKIIEAEIEALFFKEDSVLKEETSKTFSKLA
jgi:hypothetical protein